MTRRIRLRIAAGLALLALLLAGGWYGFLYWSREKVRGEVEAAFQTLRADGTKATFAEAGFDPGERAVTLTGIDIAAPDGSLAVRIARLVARGNERPHDRRVSLEALDAEGVQVTLTGAAASGGTLSYTVPKVMIDQYTGPIGIIAAGEGGGPFGGLRVALRQFAATSAAKVTIPEMKVRLVPAGGVPMEATYTELSAEGVNAGTVRSVVIDRVAFALTAPRLTLPGAPPASAGRIEGRMNGIVAAGIDTAPLLAMTDPDPARRSGDYAQVLAKLVTGPYAVQQENGPATRIASLLVERLGLRPSAFDPKRIEELRALETKGDLDAQETRRLLELARDALDGIAVRTVTASGVESAQNDIRSRVGAMRIDGLAASVMDEIALEGIEGPHPGGGTVKVGRFALRRLDLARALQMASEDNTPSPLSVLRLLTVMSGIEVADVEAPAPQAPAGGGGASEPVRLGRFAVSWSGAKGGLPTGFDLTLADLSAPMPADDGLLSGALAAAGMERPTLTLGLKAAYDADRGAIMLTPVTLDVKNAAQVAVEAQVGDVPRAAFTNAMGVFALLPAASAGPLKVTVTDRGLAALLLARLAAAEGVSVDAYRQRVLEMAQDIAADIEEGAPDAASVGEAVVAFVRDPGTLTITATPKARVPVTALLTAPDPTELIGAFAFTATATPPQR